MKTHHRVFPALVSAVILRPFTLIACLRSLVIALVALGLSPSARSAITIESYWPLGEAAAIGTDTASGTSNPFNNTAGATILTATPSSAAGSTAYAHTTGTDFQGIWMYGVGATAQTVPADNWGVQFNVRVTTLPTSGYRAVFGMAEGVSGGLVIEANNVGGTVYWDVNKQATANYIIPRNASVTVAANTWYNLALVKSGGTTYFYVNGALVGSNAGAINTSGLLGLGFEQNVGTHQLAGDFDEARFFTFAAGAFATSDLSMTKRTVTYSGNGNTGGTAPLDSGGYFPGTPVTVLAAGTLTRTGYVFNNWNTQAGGGGTSYSPAATFNIGDANTTLYAQWTAATATITAAATFPGALSTTYGTTSGSASVAVSGVNLAADITATAPSNLEVSIDNTTFGAAATFTQNGGNVSGTLYARLKNNAPVSGSLYNSQAVILTSSGATPVNVATTASGNTVSPKTLTVASATAQDKMYDGTTTGTVIGTLPTAEALGSGNSSDGIPYSGDTLTVSAPGTFSSSAIGGPYTVTAGAFTLGGSSAGNYSLTQPTGLSLSASILNTATWTQAAGGAWTNSANWLNGAIGIGADNTADFSTLNLTATTTVTLASPQTIGGLIFGDTTPDNNWIVSGSTLTLAASTTPTVNVSNQTTTISSALAGTSGMRKTGAGTLTLSANTSGAMNLTANNGTLKLAVTGLAYNNAGGVGNGGSLTVNSGATLELNGSYNLGYSQPLVIHGGTVNITSAFSYDAQQYTENVQFTAGGTITGNAMRLGDSVGSSGGTVSVSGAAAATINTGFFLINATGKTGTFDVGVTGVSGADLTVSGIIADYSGATGLPLSKTGTGTLRFSGANTYAGATTVNAGTLQVNGSLTSGGTITAQTAGTLAGTGTINRAVTIGSGGTLAAGTGSALGTLNLGSTLTLNDAGTCALRVSKTGGVTSSDRVNSSASPITYKGTLLVTNATSDTNALAAGDTFTLFAKSGGGSPATGSFATLTLPSLPDGLGWDTTLLASAGQIKVINTTVTATLTFSPAPGGYSGAQTVTILCATPGATIYYTTDDTTPSASSPSGASGLTVNVPVDTTTTIQAYAHLDTYPDSPVASATYITASAGTWTNPSGGSWTVATNWLNQAIGQGAGIPDHYNTLTLPIPSSPSTVRPPSAGCFSAMSEMTTPGPSTPEARREPSLWRAPIHPPSRWITRSPPSRQPWRAPRV